MSAAKQARRRLGDIGFKIFCWMVTGLALVALAAILWSLLAQGFDNLNLKIFTKSTPAPNSAGGLANAIVGSIMMCVLAMIMALAVGVMVVRVLRTLAREARVSGSA